MIQEPPHRPIPGRSDRSRNAGPNLAPYDGELLLFQDFLSRTENQTLHDRLLGELAWQEETIVIAGKPLRVPRLVSWYGDAGARYRYSGTLHEPRPWTSTLRELNSRVESYTGECFNSVLGNLYRDGRDSLGWHADREKELGANPAIASLSLGTTRRFLIRHNRTRETLALDLTGGSLLLMAGSLQHHWRHCVPKNGAASGARINLTFRWIRCD